MCPRGAAPPDGFSSGVRGASAGAAVKLACLAGLAGLAGVGAAFGLAFLSPADPGPSFLGPIHNSFAC